MEQFPLLKWEKTSLKSVWFQRPIKTQHCVKNHVNCGPSSPFYWYSSNVATTDLKGRDLGPQKPRSESGSKIISKKKTSGIIIEIWTQRIQDRVGRFSK